MQDDDRLIKSYVWHRESGQCFFVSTIERDSSAVVGPPPNRYAETLAWRYTWETKERGDIVAQAGEGEAFRQHTRVCEALYRHGELIEDDDTD